MFDDRRVTRRFKDKKLSNFFVSQKLEQAQNCFFGRILGGFQGALLFCGHSGFEVKISLKQIVQFGVLTVGDQTWEITAGTFRKAGLVWIPMFEADCVEQESFFILSNWTHKLNLNELRNDMLFERSDKILRFANSQFEESREQISFVRFLKQIKLKKLSHTLQISESTQRFVR